MPAQTFTAAAVAIQSHLSTNWTATDIAWDGMNGPEYRTVIGRSFIRPTVAGEIGDQKSLGSSPRFRRVGVLIVQVFVPSGDGNAGACSYSDQLVSLLEGRTLGAGITFQAVSSNPIGRDGDFYQVNVSAPFYWDRVA